MNKSLVKLVIILSPFLLLIIPFYSISFRGTSFSSIVRNRILLTIFFQRITGVMAFIFLFYQIVIGAFIDYLKKHLGEWILKLHFIFGLATSIFLIIHPFFLMIFNYFTRNIIDPFYVFSDICLLCINSYEFFLTLGRIAFWLALSMMTAIVVRKSKGWELQSRKFHHLNYFIFFLVAIHMRFINVEILRFPLKYFYLFMVITVSFIFIFKIGQKFLLKKR